MLTSTPEIRPEDLGRFFDSGTLSRARGYVGRGMVERADFDPTQRILTGSCQGSSGRAYTVRIEFVAGAAGWEIDWTSCTCPVGEFCKHAAALVLTAARPRAALAIADPWVSVDAWESMLGDILAESTPVSGGGGLPAALQISSTRAPSRHIAQDWLSLRPMTIGKRGTWIRSALSWRHLEFNSGAGEFDPDQYETLRAIAVEYRRTHPYMQSDEMPLASSPPTIWRLLLEAHAAGVQLIAHSSVGADEVVIADAATLQLDVDHDDDGVGARVSAVLEVDGQVWDAEDVLVIGSPVPHGVHRVVDRVLTLAPFSPRPGATLARLFAGGRPVTVPGHAVDKFAAEFLPRLRGSVPVRVADGSFTPPRVDGPHPVVTVDIGEDGIGHAWWSIRYHVNDQRHDFDPAARVANSSYRDAATEAQMWDEVIPAMQIVAGSAATWANQAQHHVGLHFQRTFTVGMNEELVRIRRAAGPVEAARASSLATLQAGVRLTPLETARVCVEVLPILAERFGDLIVEIDEYAAKYVAVHDDVQIEFSAPDADTEPDTTVTSDWFDLEVSVSVDGEHVALGDVFGELAVGATHMLLPSGVYFSLETPELTRLGELISEARSLGEIESGRARAGSYNPTLWEELLSLGVVDEQTQAWRQRMARLSSARPQHTVTPPESLHATLRGYQQEGLDWLSFLWDNGLGGILADDMGLGKTVQTLAVIARIVESGSEGKFLVVAPTSVVGNWVSECRRFVPGLRSVAVTATSARSRTPLATVIGDADIVVTSYALMRIDFDSYDEIDWAGVIFDEAQFVKNHNSKGHQCARRLRAPFKLAITGTPMENNLMELWSLLSITAPGLFPRPQLFTEYFRKPIESGGHPERLALLRRRIKPMMLRRKKDQVASDLPVKQEQVLAVELSSKHRKAYDTRLARERQKVLGLLGDWEKNRFAIFRSLTMLRQMSLHAGLVDESMADVASAKVDFLLEQLPELIAEGHSALVFSQFTGFLAVIRAELDAAGITYSYLDGSMSSQARSGEVAAFTSGATQVFLISLKAGGFGLNLTEADYCFICDPWWNPAAEAQAVDRAHRIGQTRPVTVYRLVSADTIEEKVVALQNRKRELFNAVIDDGDEFGTAIGASDIRALLD